MDARRSTSIRLADGYVHREEDQPVHRGLHEAGPGLSGDTFAVPHAAAIWRVYWAWRSMPIGDRERSQVRGLHFCSERCPPLCQTHPESIVNLRRFSDRERTWLAASARAFNRLPSEEKEDILFSENLASPARLAELLRRFSRLEMPMTAPTGSDDAELTLPEMATLRVALRTVRRKGYDSDFLREVAGVSPIASTHVTSMIIRLGG